MLTPIRIGKHGEMLCDSVHDSHSDDDEMYLCIGVHDVCNCYVDIKAVSDTHRAMCCRGCGLRLVIPMEVLTYGQLRAYQELDIRLNPW
jgi:hypothetical protein